MKIQLSLILSIVSIFFSACMSVQGMKEINLPYTKQSNFSLDFPRHQTLDCDLGDEKLYVIVHRPKTCDSAYTIADCHRDMAKFLPKLKEMGIEPTVIAFYDEIQKESWFHDIKDVYRDGRFESVSLYLPKNCQMVFKYQSKQNAQKSSSLKQRDLQGKSEKEVIELEQGQSQSTSSQTSQTDLPQTENEATQSQNLKPSTQPTVEGSKTSESNTTNPPKNKNNKNKNKNKADTPRFQ